jgi:hypothetical protein
VDTDYWKARCLAAEKALALARRGLPMSQQRRSVLTLLADLKAGADADTHRIAAEMNCSPDHAWTWLKTMERLGLVECPQQGRKGPGGTPARWRLGYLVQVEACE